MLWILIRNACEVLLMSTYNIVFEEKIEKYKYFFILEKPP